MRIRLISLLITLLCACQPQETAIPLPTAVDLNVLATEAAATGVMLTQTADANRPPALPPTWTPPAVTQATAQTVDEVGLTPQGAFPTGTIYYIYNNDSIARVGADGSLPEELVLTGYTPADLALSPDETLLTFVGQGNGNAREVYVTNLDGSYLQQISCLGYQRVENPTWSPDGSLLAFLAAPSPLEPLELFIASFAGSNNCPSGNNQRQLTQLASQSLGGKLSWSNDGTLIFFSNYGIAALNVTSGAIIDVTIPTGFGPDFNPIYDPNHDRLYFLRPQELNRDGGHVFRAEAGIELGESSAFGVVGYFASDIVWSRDGENMLITAEGDIYSYDLSLGSTVTVIESMLGIDPYAQYSPDGEWVALIGLGGIAPQVYVVPRAGGDITSLTAHTEGTASDLVWASE